ncbi:MAG: hypothetical protein RLZZ385_2218 [Pseudomonadota bacterium]|jgi:RNA polymerase sigma-70 factor (ECF subfamily)
MLALYQKALEQYRQRVYSFALYSLRAQADAEDVTQDVFIRLWQHWRKIDHSRQGAWLMRVAHNAVIDHIRRRRSQGDVLPVPEDLAGETEDGESVLENEQFREELTRAISNLGDPYRSILIMRDIQGLSYEEIEHSLQLSQSQVKVYLHRARRRLREEPGLRRLAMEHALVADDRDPCTTNELTQSQRHTLKAGSRHG